MSSTVSVSTSVADRELAASRKQCRDIARSHYENFVVASVLLPRRMRQPFYDVYAFCRAADDAADESASTAAANEALASFRISIANIYSGGEVTGPFVALAETVRRFHLPRKPFDDLLDAFVQDQTVHRYRDESMLLDYCCRSANPVGRIVLALGGCDTESHFRLSDDICTGLQLANFWQDVTRDFAIGRVYLPESVMHRHGFDAAVLAETITHSRPTPACVRDAIAEQCDRARGRLRRGRTLVATVPRWLAADVELFVRGGLATLDAIARIQYDVLRYRPKVSKRKQAWLVASTFVRGVMGRPHGNGTGDEAIAPVTGGSHQ